MSAPISKWFVYHSVDEDDFPDAVEADEPGPGCVEGMPGALMFMLRGEDEP